MTSASAVSAAGGGGGGHDHCGHLQATDEVARPFVTLVMMNGEKHTVFFEDVYPQVANVVLPAAQKILSATGVENDALPVPMSLCQFYVETSAAGTPGPSTSDNADDCPREAVDASGATAAADLSSKEEKNSQTASMLDEGGDVEWEKLSNYAKIEHGQEIRIQCEGPARYVCEDREKLCHHFARVPAHTGWLYYNLDRLGLVECMRVMLSLPRFDERPFDWEGFPYEEEPYNHRWGKALNAWGRMGRKFERDPLFEASFVRLCLRHSAPLWAMTWHWVEDGKRSCLLSSNQGHLSRDEQSKKRWTQWQIGGLFFWVFKHLEHRNRCSSREDAPMRDLLALEERVDLVSSFGEVVEKYEGMFEIEREKVRVEYPKQCNCQEIMLLIMYQLAKSCESEGADPLTVTQTKRLCGALNALRAEALPLEQKWSNIGQEIRRRAGKCGAMIELCIKYKCSLADGNEADDNDNGEDDDAEEFRLRLARAQNCPEGGFYDDLEISEYLRDLRRWHAQLRSDAPADDDVAIFIRRPVNQIRRMDLQPKRPATMGRLSIEGTAEKFKILEARLLRAALDRCGEK